MNTLHDHDENVENFSANGYEYWLNKQDGGEDAVFAQRWLEALGQFRSRYLSCDEAQKLIDLLRQTGTVSEPKKGIKGVAQYQKGEIRAFADICLLLFARGLNVNVLPALGGMPGYADLERRARIFDPKIDLGCPDARKILGRLEKAVIDESDDGNKGMLFAAWVRLTRMSTFSTKIPKAKQLELGFNVSQSNLHPEYSLQDLLPTSLAQELFREPEGSVHSQRKEQGEKPQDAVVIAPPPRPIVESVAEIVPAQTPAELIEGQVDEQRDQIFKILIGLYDQLSALRSLEAPQLPLDTIAHGMAVAQCQAGMQLCLRELHIDDLLHPAPVGGAVDRTTSSPALRSISTAEPWLSFHSGTLSATPEFQKLLTLNRLSAAVVFLSGPSPESTGSSAE